MLAVQPLSQAPSKLPPMQDTCAAWWMHCFPSACLSPRWPPQNLISYKRSRTATWGPDLFGMTLKQSIEISLCIDIYRALGGSDSYCNAARLKFDLERIILQNSLYLSIKALLDKTTCLLVRGAITVLQWQLSLLYSHWWSSIWTVWVLWAVLSSI